MDITKLQPRQAVMCLSAVVEELLTLVCFYHIAVVSKTYITRLITKNTLCMLAKCSVKYFFCCCCMFMVI